MKISSAPSTTIAAIAAIFDHRNQSTVTTIRVECLSVPEVPKTLVLYVPLGVLVVVVMVSVVVAGSVPSRVTGAAEHVEACGAAQVTVIV